MRDYTKTIELKTTTGAKITVSQTLTLSKTINADGDKVCVECCDLGPVEAVIDGFPDQSCFINFPEPKQEKMGLIYGCIGKLGLLKDNYDKVVELVEAVKRHPAWIAKQSKIDDNIKANKALDAQRKANGYCEKCGSYCYGDC